MPASNQLPVCPHCLCLRGFTCREQCACHDHDVIAEAVARAAPLSDEAIAELRDLLPLPRKQAP